jgi:hypothetical protein
VNIKNKNYVHEEIQRRLNSGNACSHSVQNLFSSTLLFKNIKIKIYRTVILPRILYGYETWFLTLREEHRLRVYENRVLMRIFGLKRDEVEGDWGRLHNEEPHDLYILLTKYNSGSKIKNSEMGGACSTYGGEERCI